MTKDEALKLALEALEEINKLSVGENAICLPAEIDGAMDALRERLAQPKQEPVAYYHPRSGFYWAKPTSIFAPTIVDVPRLPLYTSPAPQRTWVGLTDEEETELIRLAHNHAGIRFYIQAAEAKLKEKNT